MIKVSPQLIDQATEIAGMMLTSEAEFAPIGATGFFLLRDRNMSGYTALHALDLSGERFYIAWQR